jgi:hypothetical protein
MLELQYATVFGKLKGASTARGVSKRHMQKDKKLCKKLDNDDSGFIDKKKDKHKDKNKTATNTLGS